MYPAANEASTTIQTAQREANDGPPARPLYILHVYAYISPEVPIKHLHRVSPYAILAEYQGEASDEDAPDWTRWEIGAIHEHRKPRADIASLFMTLALKRPNLAEVRIQISFSAWQTTYLHMPAGYLS